MEPNPYEAPTEDGYHPPMPPVVRPVTRWQIALNVAFALGFFAYLIYWMIVGNWIERLVIGLVLVVVACLPFVFRPVIDD